MQMDEAEIEGYDGQLVLLTADCVEQRGTILHELGHVIGFFHEHNRPDRDNFIEIQWENVREDLHDQFDKIPTTDVDSLGVPYDFGSIMHYSLDAFSKNGNATMKVISNPQGYTGEVGQRQGLSDLDARQANLLYSCSAGKYLFLLPPPPLLFLFLLFLLLLLLLLHHLFLLLSPLSPPAFPPPLPPPPRVAKYV